MPGTKPEPAPKAWRIEGRTRRGKRRPDRRRVCHEVGVDSPSMTPDDGPPGLDRLLAHVRGVEPAFIRDLQHLVNIDSGTHTKAGVDRVSRWMGQQLAGLGASVIRRSHHELGETLVATFDGPDEGPTVLLIGHADTVFEAGTAAGRPFSIEDGRGKGPGVGDMKGGLLTGLYALSALRAMSADAREWLPVGRVVFIVNPDEEIGSPLSTPIIREQAARAHAAFVLEGGRPDGAVVSTRAGMLHLRIAVEGRAAHAGVEPERGRNAIVEAAHKIVALAELTDRAKGVTVNVGEIEGGTRPNVVPAAATLAVDVRATTLEAMEAAESAIHAIVSASAVADTSSSLEVAARYAPMEPTPGSVRLRDSATAIAAELGFELHHTSSRGASDANTTAGVGVATLDGLGPVGGAWHTANEYIELDSVVPRTVMLAALLVAVGRDRELTS